MWAQLPYIAQLEEAGVPTVLLTFEDQLSMIQHTGLQQGFPQVRTVSASRTMPGPEDVDTWVDEILDQLVRPLTEKEKRKFLYLYKVQHFCLGLRHIG